MNEEHLCLWYPELNAYQISRLMREFKAERSVGVVEGLESARTIARKCEGVIACIEQINTQIKTFEVTKNGNDDRL